MYDPWCTDRFLRTKFTDWIHPLTGIIDAMRNLRLALFLVLATACGSNSSSSGDAGPGDAGPNDTDAGSDCGDLMVTGNEQCDDGNDVDDDACRNDCTFSCGDGILGAGELCDTGIAAGEDGACPTDCNDDDACTSDVVSEDSCQTMCINATISAFTNDDGCCPENGDNTLDNDCAVVCGNGVVESGESCDTAIASGNAGACVEAADCIDGQSCTSDNLLNGGSCTAACDNPVIDTPINDDGCCPTGGNIGTDNDCPAGCGDGVVTPPETCDTAIANDCPVQADCVDGDSCTQDILLSGGTCLAECSNPVISAIANGDGCCPAGANANNDDDCTPVCGNNVVESGEQCDDNNTDNGDGCDENCQNEIVAPTAFRVNAIRLRDPHAFADVFGFLCLDATEDPFGMPGINPTFDENTDTDGDGDGLLDLSIAQVFRPLDQGATVNTVEVHFPDCTDPIDSTTCTSTTTTPDIVTATNASTGTCLEPVAGTTGPDNTGTYTPAASNSTGPCFSTSPSVLVLDVDGMVITLEDAQFGGTYVGDPATDIDNGLLIGFLSEANADAATIPDNVPIVNGQPLSSILPGGTGCCVGHDAMDVGPDGSTPGWWMALNYDATVVPWTDL
jgi:cysteine-rich repeat protein